MTDRAAARAAEPSPDAPLSRRERRKLELRERVIEVAKALFTEQGFQETRVAEICERADIAQKTFFNHFPTKLHLLRELAHAGIAQLLVEIEGICKADLSTRDRVFQLFDTVAEHMEAAGPRNRELVTETVHAISAEPDHRSDQARQLSSGFEVIVEAGVAQGDVTRRHDVATLAELLLGAYYVLIFNYANLDDFPIRKRAQAAARVVSDALAAHSEEDHGQA